MPVILYRIVSLFSPRKIRFHFVLLLVVLILVACAGPQPLPSNPTPIPTLIPATMPPGGQAIEEIAPPVEASHPAGKPSAGRGQALYNEHCTECHGADGKGMVPNARDFSDVDYMRGETPIAFYSTITSGHGEVSDEMPAFGDILTSDQRWDLVYFVWRFSTSDELLVKGHEIYTDNCIACHGEDGQSMILSAANFSDHTFLSKRADSELFVSVTQGRGSMPAWQVRLDQDERWAVIDYMRAFSYDAVLTTGGETEIVFLPEATPVPEVSTCDQAYLEQTNPFAWDDAEAIAAGEAIYNINCFSCHGEDGRGVAGLGFIVPDLTDPGFQKSLLDNTGGLLCSLAEGLNVMPSYKRNLSDEEMWQTLMYLATFGD